MHVLHMQDTGHTGAALSANGKKKHVEANMRSTKEDMKNRIDTHKEKGH